MPGQSMGTVVLSHAIINSGLKLFGSLDYAEPWIFTFNIINNLTVTDKALFQIYWFFRDFTDFFSECSSINDEISFHPFSVTIIHFIMQLLFSEPSQRNPTPL